MIRVRIDPCRAVSMLDVNVAGCPMLKSNVECQMSACLVKMIWVKDQHAQAQQWLMHDPVLSLSPSVSISPPLTGPLQGPFTDWIHSVPEPFVSGFLVGPDITKYIQFDL